MSKPEFVYVTYIETTPEKLWEALTNVEFSKRYWFGTEVKSDWQVGSPFALVTDGKTTDTGQILEADRRAVHRAAVLDDLARIELEQLPLLPDAAHQVRAEPWPPGTRANRAQIATGSAWADGTPLAVEGGSSDRELLASLACDAQTSGGLLLCVPVAHADACVVELRTQGLAAAQIGSLAAAGGGPAVILR